MTFIYVITVLLILLIVIKEVRYLKDVEIKTIKSKSEMVAMLIAIVAIMVMIFMLANNLSHYIVGCAGILFVFADVQKQGISAKGLLIVARGKELYKWCEIDHADITISNQIKITYISKSKSKIGTQLYPSSMYDKITDVFRENKLPFQTTNT